MVSGESKMTTRQVVPPSPAAANRSGRSLSTNERSVSVPRRGRRRAGEIAGGTAAECAAVCCCCPFTVINLIVLAVYKVPVALCKKAIRKRKRQRLQQKKKNDMLLIVNDNGNVKKSLDEQLAVAMTPSKTDDGGAVAGESDYAALEKEMWAQFQGTGFWRSPSQRLEQ